MSRRKNRVPSYSLHKTSGQARVVIGGRSIYFGKYGSPESHEAYAREVAKLAFDAVDSPALKLHAAPGDDLSVNEVILLSLLAKEGAERGAEGSVDADRSAAELNSFDHECCGAC